MLPTACSQRLLLAELRDVLATGSLGRFPTELVPLHYVGLALSLLGAVAVGYSLCCAAFDLRVIVSSD
eukprot:COSAG02_NODE_4878_length_4870_cov_4.067281_5_plen_68_part_00